MSFCHLDKLVEQKTFIIKKKDVGLSRAEKRKNGNKGHIFE